MHCPVCKAENAEDPTCRRCRADLTLLVAMEKSRRHALTQAAHAAARGDGMRTLQHAEVAHQLRRDDESWRWLAVGGLLVHDFALALACYRHARSKPGGP